MPHIRYVLITNSSALFSERCAHIAGFGVQAARQFQPQ
jgi:hypothetical protein